MTSNGEKSSLESQEEKTQEQYPFNTVLKAYCLIRIAFLFLTLSLSAVEILFASASLRNHWNQVRSSCSVKVFVENPAAFQKSLINFHAMQKASSTMLHFESHFIFIVETVK